MGVFSSNRRSADVNHPCWRWKHSWADWLFPQANIRICGSRFVSEKLGTTSPPHKFSCHRGARFIIWRTDPMFWFIFAEWQQSKKRDFRAVISHPSKEVAHWQYYYPSPLQLYWQESVFHSRQFRRCNMMEEDPELGLYLTDKEPRTSLLKWYGWKLRYDQQRRWKWRCHSWYSHQCRKPWYHRWYFVAWLLHFVNRGSEKSERLVCTEENNSSHLHLLRNNSSLKVIHCIPHGNICWCQWLKQKDEEITYETVSHSRGVKYNGKLTCGKSWTFWTPSPTGPSTGNRQLQNPITSRVSWFCSLDESCVQTRIQVSSPSPTFPQSPSAENWFTDDMHMYSMQHTCHHHYRTTIPAAIWFAANPAGRATFTRFKPCMSTPPLLWACLPNL